MNFDEWLEGLSRTEFGLLFVAVVLGCGAVGGLLSMAFVQ